MADWTVARVRGGHEFKFADWCGRHGVEVYVPAGKKKITPRRKHSSVVVEIPIFKTYAFVGLDFQTLSVVRAAPGYFWVMATEDGLCTVEQTSIDELRQRQRVGAFDWISPALRHKLTIAIGSEMTVERGILAGRHGRVIRVPQNASYVILDVGGKVVKMRLTVPEPGW